jgi:hypothetical protein
LVYVKFVLLIFSRNCECRHRPSNTHPRRNQRYNNGYALHARNLPLSHPLVG